MRRERGSKRVPFGFRPMDLRALQAYLEQEAAEGWELTRVGTRTADFRRTYRPGLRYSVDLFNSLSAAEREDYLRLCEEAGWERVEGGGGFDIFKSRPGTAPAPIQTDEALELERFEKRYLIKEILLNLLGLIVFVPVTVACVHISNNRPYDLWMSNVRLLYVCWLVCLGAWGLIATACLLRFWYRCRRAGRLLDTGRAAIEARRRIARWIPALFLLLLLGAGWSDLSGALRPAPAPDAIAAVTAEDLGVEGVEAPYADLSGSLLVRRASCDQSAPTRYERLDGSISESYLAVLSDRFTCAWPWLARHIAALLLADETQDRYPEWAHHAHRALTMEPVDLGFDRAWLGRTDGERQCLVLVQGRVAVRLEAPVDFTDPAVLALVRDRLALAP